MKATGNFEACQNVDPMVVLSDKTRAHIDHWLTKFPPDRKRSAVLQGLHAAQEQNEGWVSEAAIRVVAEGRDGDTRLSDIMSGDRLTQLPQTLGDQVQPSNQKVRSTGNRSRCRQVQQGLVITAQHIAPPSGSNHGKIDHPVAQEPLGQRLVAVEHAGLHRHTQTVA